MTRQEQVDQLRRELAALKAEDRNPKTPHQKAMLKQEIIATARLLGRLLESDPALR